jgi:hypothetical protein
MVFMEFLKVFSKKRNAVANTSINKDCEHQNKKQEITRSQISGPTGTISSIQQE